MVRTIAQAATRVTALYAVANGIYWGEQSGAGAAKDRFHDHDAAVDQCLVPTSIATNGYTACAEQVWTECGGQTCRMQFDFPSVSWSTAIGVNALGAAVTSSGNVFWGDSAGVHRQLF